MCTVAAIGRFRKKDRAEVDKKRDSRYDDVKVDMTTGK